MRYNGKNGYVLPNIQKSVFPWSHLTEKECTRFTVVAFFKNVESCWPIFFIISKLFHTFSDLASPLCLPATPHCVSRSRRLSIMNETIEKASPADQDERDAFLKVLIEEYWLFC